MRRVYGRTFTAPQESIDINGHVNNLEYLRWMQDIATRHSAAQGWTLERYMETQTSWVIRSHTIEYRRPAFAGDKLTLLTWIAGFGENSSPRRYLFWRAADQQILARAETIWVFVDARADRPGRIPEEFRSVFDIVTDDEEVLQVAREGFA